MHELFVAACLMLVIEGILPFVAPRRWRLMMLNVMGMADAQIRAIGFVSMVTGALLLYIFN